MLRAPNKINPRLTGEGRNPENASLGFGIQLKDRNDGAQTPAPFLAKILNCGRGILAFC